MISRKSFSLFLAVAGLYLSFQSDYYVTSLELVDDYSDYANQAFAPRPDLTQNQKKLLTLRQQDLDTELLKQMPKADDGRQMVVVEYFSTPKVIYPSGNDKSNTRLRLIGAPLKKVASAPIYSYLDRAFTRERRVYDNLVIGHIARVLEKLNQGLIIDDMYAISAGYAFVSDVKSMGGSFKRQLEMINKGDISPPMVDGYTKSMAGLIRDIIDSSDKYVSKNALSRDEVFRSVLDILEATKQLGQNSLAGLYLDWTKMTLNGKPITEITAPVIQWYKSRGAGYKLLLKLVKSLSGWMGNLRVSNNPKQKDEVENETVYNDTDEEIVEQLLVPVKLNCKVVPEPKQEVDNYDDDD